MPMPSTMVELSFAVEATAGEQLPRDHRQQLADALERALPWLAEVPLAGVHRLNVSAGAGPLVLLSRRTRLTLRVPRERSAQAAALAGTELKLGVHRLRLGSAQERELQPYSTLYAHFVAADDADEIAFLRSAQDAMTALGVPCRVICGRHQVLEDGALQGFSLMLDGLSPATALRVLETGLGRHRRLGCGLFVGHKSAAAVGTPF
ncbi:MAG: type I-MYXAN CRISPR-associated protein Cas6/Cmx6 [Rubrivivax sp.]|nr:type I-MYXAN CRISPR-associated protein Cas6/Cmx6 [Rubrivivax sp.]